MMEERERKKKARGEAQRSGRRGEKGRREEKKQKGAKRGDAGGGVIKKG